MVDIKELSMQNNFYRDMIRRCKDEISDWDRKIQANEIEIGKQLNDMSHFDHQGLPEWGCEMCMGECNGNL